MNEPQLSADKDLDPHFPELLKYDWSRHTIGERTRKEIIAYLEEQSRLHVEQVEKMKKTDKFPQSLTTYDGKTKYFNRLSDGDLHYNKAIDDVLAKLNQLKGTK